MAARHFADDFSEEMGTDMESPYASGAQGRHLRKPDIEYVPADADDESKPPLAEDPLADERARKYVEEIFRELTEPPTPEPVDDADQNKVRNTMTLKSSGILDTLPDFGPPQSKLSEFVPSMDVVPHDWGEPVREGVFARNDSANKGTKQANNMDPSTTVVLDQQKLHGLRRRHESMRNAQIELVRGPNRLEQSFGYYSPNNVPQLSEGNALSIRHRRKSLFGIVAGFIASLFGRLRH